MRTLPRLSSAVAMLLLSLAAVPQGHGQTTGRAGEAAFLRAVGENFGFPSSELEVLRRWGLSAGEIPVVLFLAKRAGVSPDVVVTQRGGGESWMAVAGRYSLHAGDFHVQLDGPYGALAGAYNRFNERPASDWREIPLSDVEVVGLVNARFLAGYLNVSPGRAAQELGQGDVVGAFLRLRGRDAP